jgi:hypothetical protein
MEGHRRRVEPSGLRHVAGPFQDGSTMRLRPFSSLSFSSFSSFASPAARPRLALLLLTGVAGAIAVASPSARAGGNSGPGQGGGSSSTDLVAFDLAQNPKFASCLAEYPDDATRAPSVHVEVRRGSLADTMTIRGKYIKPNLAFDLFTVQNDQLLADGTPDPNFANFGLAWYQSDLEADTNGEMRASIKTILLDQIFGFDPAVSLPPTGTFEVGFWFNDPNDATACGFDATKPTPFNGEHQAGPLAMISLPDATTGLGPLCTKPDTSVSPARCSP